MAVLIKIFKIFHSVEGELIFSAEPARLQEIAPNLQTQVALVSSGGSQNKTNSCEHDREICGRGKDR